MLRRCTNRLRVTRFRFARSRCTRFRFTRLAAHGIVVRAAPSIVERLRRGLPAAAALVVLVVGVPWLLLRASRWRFDTPNPLAGLRAPWSWTRDEVEGSLRRPLEDDTVADIVVRLSLVVAWLALAVMVVTVALEIVHLVRHRDAPPPRRRGLGWWQPAARSIAVGLVALLPLATRAPVQAHSPIDVLGDSRSMSATAEWAATDELASLLGGDVTSRPEDRTTSTNVVSAETGVASPESAGDPALGRGETLHVVERGESVWSIASGLGDGSETSTLRLAEVILDRNLGTLMNDGSEFSNPALIRPGWQLVVPAAGSSPVAPPGRVGGPAPDPAVTDAADTDADPTGASLVVVERGDTLSSIAAEHLGDGSAWTELAADNLGRTMPDGRIFDDPDLIVPGWTIDVGGAGVDTGAETPIDTESDSADGPSPGTDPERAEPTGPRASPPDRDTPDDWFATPTESSRPGSGGVGSSGAPEADDTAGDWFDDEVVLAPPTTAPVAGLPVPADSTADAGSTTSTTSADAAQSTRPVSPGSSSPSSTIVPVADGPSGADDIEADEPAGAPAPLGLGHAAMLAGGVLALAAVRRRRRLRAARPHARTPAPRDDIESTTRTLRQLGAAERTARLDVAVRALTARLLDSGARPGAIVHGDDGTIEVALTAPFEVGAPWVGAGSRWELAGSIPIELLADEARRIGPPCPAMVAVGRAGPAEVLVDLEAAGLVVIEGPDDHVDAIIRALAATLATSVAAETTHLVSVGFDGVDFGHPNASVADDGATAFRSAIDAVGSLVDHPSGSLELRARRTGGEAWEPAVVIISTAGAAGSSGAPVPIDAMPDPGHGLAVVTPGPLGDSVRAVRLVGAPAGWRLDGFGWELDIEPIGLSPEELARLVEVVEHADRLEAPAPTLAVDALVEERSAASGEFGSDSVTPADDPRSEQTRTTEPTSDAASRAPATSSEPRPGAEVTGAAAAAVDPRRAVPDHAIIVSTLGGVAITGAGGETQTWQRSKTVELIAWLVTHRHRSTRSAARTAMWEDDVRDATFSNVVSEARRGLARLVQPAEGEEWIPRTMNEELLLHRLVVSDVDLLRARLDAATTAAPAEAVAVLRPGLRHVTGLPFADTSYLWPDADGIVTDSILLATTYCTELSEHALSLGDVETVFAATSHGLAVLPGHEDLIALRMRAHARGGDLASVRAEWASYERVVTADAWSDGEPSPRLVDLRRELLA